MFGHVADAFDEKSIFKIGQSQTTTTQTTTTTTQTAAASDQTTTTTGSSVGDGDNEVDLSPHSDSSGTNDGVVETADNELDSDIGQKRQETPLDVVCCQ